MAGSATGVPVRSGRTRAKVQRLRLDLGFVAVAQRRIEACTNQKTDREAAMRQFMMTVMALAVLGAMVATAQAENQTPNPPTASHPAKKRTVSSKAINLPSETAVADTMGHSTCTGLRSVCISYHDRHFAAAHALPPSLEVWRAWREANGISLERERPYLQKYCNFTWEQCMKTGWWEGLLYTAQPNAVKS
jgi:hypothetical protein